MINILQCIIYSFDLILVDTINNNNNKDYYYIGQKKKKRKKEKKKKRKKEKKKRKRKLQMTLYHIRDDKLLLNQEI